MHRAIAYVDYDIEQSFLESVAITKTSLSSNQVEVEQYLHVRLCSPASHHNAMNQMLGEDVYTRLVKEIESGCNYSLDGLSKDHVL